MRHLRRSTTDSPAIARTSLGRTSGLLFALGALNCSSPGQTDPNQGGLTPNEPQPTSGNAEDASAPPAPVDVDPNVAPIVAAPTPPAEPSTPAAPPPVDPCVAADCGEGFRCEAEADTAACVENTCEDLACSATELCVPHTAGGNICRDNSCAEDVDCAPQEHCGEGGTCVPDTCEPGTRTCEGNDVLECASNGAARDVAYSCSTSTAFESTCQDFAGQATCTCGDDWDCPANTVCEVDRCVGSGKAPTCTVPPQAFSDTRPQIEIRWGGSAPDADVALDGSGDGTLAPWSASSHITATALVANLDDDNGDGLINELDYPEILFITYASQALETTGVVRAIHGGGQSRGKDFFARCGNSVWHEGSPLPEGDCTTDLGPTARGRSAMAVGDLTGNGVPEIVYTTAGNGFRILDNRGELLLDADDMVLYTGQAIGGGARGGDFSIANLDGVGMPELVYGNTVIVLGMDEQGGLLVTHRLDGEETQGSNDTIGAMTCVADLAPNPGQEVLAGTTLYRMPDNLGECAAPPCAGALEVVWSAAAVNSEELAQTEGYCAVADVWGADSSPPGASNPPDGVPEAVLIANGYLLILDGATGGLIDQRALDTGDDGVTPGGGGTRGGAPNVDDFDGDGYMEIASALSNYYIVVDLQEPSAACPEWPTLLPAEGANPNLNEGLTRDPGGACTTDEECAEGAVCNTLASACVCLHNGWFRDTDDNSSRATSSSVFDFNGDGAAEALYNDECNFFVYDGRSGEILTAEVSRSRTWTENPVVADVDNDGNAEVITVANTELIQCDVASGGEDAEEAGYNGLTVWGDPTDTWVSARRIWNQASYHVTNITESAAVPLVEPNSWEVFNGRSYNTYRSQPRVYGVAPDLTVAAISISSPDVACGQLSDVIEVAFQVENLGDIRVGPGVEVSLYGTWDGTEEALQAPGGALTVVLDQSIEPSKSIIRTATFNVADQANRDTLPESVRVVVDSGGAADSTFGAERECNEDNNTLSEAVQPGETRPDLVISVGEVSVDCSKRIASVVVVVGNEGTEAAEGTTVDLYLGNPAQGGELVINVALDEVLEPGAEVTLTVDVEDFPANREVTFWGSVDPDNLLNECNEADNSDPADNPVACPINNDPR